MPLYYIARYETSVAQFAAYLNATGQSSSAVEGLAPDLPITGITWPEALAYTRWLDLALRQSDQTPAELRAFLKAGRVTLPSEAEWEKAARGNEGQVFLWRSGPPPESVNLMAAKYALSTRWTVLNAPGDCPTWRVTSGK